jgi:DNA invertase Pin-like site-specific DNA recombinase
VKAKNKGVRFGARRKPVSEQIKELKRRREAGVLIKLLMKEYDLSKASVYRYLEMLDD